MRDSSGVGLWTGTSGKGKIENMRPYTIQNTIKKHTHIHVTCKICTVLGDWRKDVTVRFLCVQYIAVL